MTGKLVTLCLLAGVLCINATPYPSTYPYENEVFKPPNLVDATPSHTYTNDDEGGYYLRSIGCDLNEPELEEKWGFNAYAFCNYDEYAAQVFWGMFPSDFTVEAFNCTKNGLIYTSSMWSGQIAKKEVCTSGECCQDFEGQALFDPSVETYEEVWSTRADSGMCSTMPEPAYCIGTAAYAANVCVGYFVNPGGRPYMSPCAQNIGQFLSTCGVFKETGASGLVNEEPARYQARLSPEQTFTLVGLSYIFDRVCLPYSYYFPEVNGDSVDQNDSADQKDPADSADSSTATNALPVLLLAAAMFS